MNHLTKSSDSDSGYLWATWHQNCSSGKTHSKEKGNTEAEQGKESSWTSAVSPGMPAVSSLLTQRASQNWTGTHQIKECLSFQVECLDPRTQRQDFLVQPAVVLHGLLQLRPVWTQHMDWSPALTVPQPFASTKLRAELSHEFLKLHCPYAQLCDSRVHTDACGSTVPSLDRGLWCWRSRFDTSTTKLCHLYCRSTAVSSWNPPTIHHTSYALFPVAARISSTDKPGACPQNVLQSKTVWKKFPYEWKLTWHSLFAMSRERTSLLMYCYLGHDE